MVPADMASAHMACTQTHEQTLRQVHDLESMQPAIQESAEQREQLEAAEMGEAWFPLLDDSGQQVCTLPQ